MTTHPVGSFLCPVTIGRERELTAIGEWLSHPDPGVLLVSGEAGVGKSRLVREAWRRAEALGYRVLQGGCFEPDRFLPYAPIRDVLLGLADLLPRDEIAQLAGPGAPDLARLVPDLADLASPHQEGDTDTAAEKRRLLDALVRLLRGLAADRPLLVTVEDLHWSDDGGLDALLYLARRTAGRSLAFLLTFRGEEVHPSLGHFLASLDRERLATELALDRLTPAMVDAMLRAIFDLKRPTPADLLHAIYTLTEGNPFIVEEMLKELSAFGDILSPSGIWQRRPGDELRIPRSVQDAVRRRLERVGSDARRLVILAAVAGRRFDFDLLQGLTGHDEHELLDLLKELVAAQLVEEQSADRFAFRHALTQQAIYAALLERERRSLHRQIAESVERRYAAALDARVDELAHHFFQARMWRPALTYARRAGEKAALLHAPRVAVEQFDRALAAAGHLALPGDPALLRARGLAHETLGDFAQARQDYEAARAIAQGTDDRRTEWQALLDLGLLWSGRDYDHAGAHLRHALTLAREIGDPAIVARSLNRVGNWLVNTEQPDDARRHHQEALAIFESLLDPHGTAETLDLLGLASGLAGDLLQSARHSERAIALWRKLDDRRGLASSLVTVSSRGTNFHTNTVPVVANLRDVRRDAEEAVAIARAIGWRAGEAWALWELGGMCDGSAGEYDRALEATLASLAIAEEIEHRQWAVGAHCALGNIYADLTALPRARHHLETALRLARETASLYWVRSAAGWLASVAVQQQDLAAAEAVLAATLDAKTPKDTIAARLLWCARAELALAGGDAADALDVVEQLISTVRNGAEHPIPRLLKLKGEALFALGRVGEAERLLLTAREAATRLGARPLEWRIGLTLGQLYRTQAQHDAAERAFAAARAIVEELAATVPDVELQEGFVTAATALLPPDADRSRRSVSDGASGGLTKREHEVAALVAAGKTNREIAEALFISEWTAATRVRNILAKLDLASRAEIAAWAVAHGLADHP